jgi:hypothetical protein
VVTVEGYGDASRLKLDDSTSSVEGGHTYNISDAQASGASVKVERMAKDSLAAVTVNFSGIKGLEVLTAQDGGLLNSTYLTGVTQDLTGTMGVLKFDGCGKMQMNPPSPLKAYGTPYGEVFFRNFAIRDIFNIITSEYTVGVSAAHLTMLPFTLTGQSQSPAFRNLYSGNTEGLAFLINNGVRQPSPASGDGSDDNDANNAGIR